MPVINKIALCPTCGKRIYLRIQDSNFLKQYPIRIHCGNCKTLIKGSFLMEGYLDGKLTLYNSTIEECKCDPETMQIYNADYVIEISGELPCERLKQFDGNMIIGGPFIKESSKLKSTTNFIKRLSCFKDNLSKWNSNESIAFQLFLDGSMDYISIALNNRMGVYQYPCPNWLKALHCLQELLLEETKYLFIDSSQDNYLHDLYSWLLLLPKDQINAFITAFESHQSLLSSYQRVISVFVSFMNIYPNLLPAEAFLHYVALPPNDMCISTCSFTDIKSFYQDTYETILSLTQVPLCLDNIIIRKDFESFSSTITELFQKKRYNDYSNNYMKYLNIDNGKRLDLYSSDEPIQKIVSIPANKYLRNGIGHNNVKYDGVTQKIYLYNRFESQEPIMELSLMNMAMDCIGLVKSAVVMAEIILFLLRCKMQSDGIRSMRHPRFYSSVNVNDTCPCGSGKKYKKCCKNDVETALRSIK